MLIGNYFHEESSAIAPSRNKMFYNKLFDMLIGNYFNDECMDSMALFVYCVREKLHTKDKGM